MNSSPSSHSSTGISSPSRNRFTASASSAVTVTVYSAPTSTISGSAARTTSTTRKEMELSDSVKPSAWALTTMLYRPAGREPVLMFTVKSALSFALVSTFISPLGSQTAM